MNRTKHCKRVVLAGLDGCQVLYCPECKVAELEVGSLSMRLEAGAFRTLVGMMNSASLTLERVQSALVNQPQMMESSSHVH